MACDRGEGSADVLSYKGRGEEQGESVQDLLGAERWPRASFFLLAADGGEQRGNVEHALERLRREGWSETALCSWLREQAFLLHRRRIVGDGVPPFMVRVCLMRTFLAHWISPDGFGELLRTFLATEVVGKSWNDWMVHRYYEGHEENYAKAEALVQLCGRVVPLSSGGETTGWQYAVLVNPRGECDPLGFKGRWIQFIRDEAETERVGVQHVLIEHEPSDNEAARAWLSLVKRELLETEESNVFGSWGEVGPALEQRYELDDS